MKHVYAVYHIHKLSEQNNVNKSLKLVHGLYEVKNIKISVQSHGCFVDVISATYLLSYPGKRSIDYPAQGKPYNVSPPLERRDLWGVSVDGSRYTVVRTHPNFDPNPGGLFIIRKTHA